MLARNSLNRDILRLALPAFGALVAPALFLVVDAVIVGTLGPVSLAALGVGANVIATVLALSIFLAYGTTASVGRLVGSNRIKEAFTETQTAAFFAVALGVLVATIIWFGARPLTAAVAPADVVDAATTYLQISSLAVPMLFLSMALTGALRGFQDVKATLYVSVLAVLVNTVTCWVAVLVLGWGIAGSAWSTVLAEVVAILGYLIAINRHKQGTWLKWQPTASSIKKMLVSSILLFWRTAMLRLTLLAVLLVASAYGTITLAAYHASFTVYGVAVFALDALAIAAQALVSKSLGAVDAAVVKDVARRITWWSLGLGALLAALLAGFSKPLSLLFTDDVAVRNQTATALLFVAMLMLPASLTFAWDGILIGASDFKFLAVAQTLVLLLVMPLLWWTWRYRSDIEWLWVCLGWWLVLRALLLGWRLTGTNWQETNRVGAR